MTTKKCSKCGGEKSLSKFVKSSRDDSGYANICLECNRLRSKTKEGLIIQIYSNQKKRLKNGRIDYINYTRIELYEWCMSQEIFHKLHKKWEESGYKTDLAPSIDRLDDYKGYDFDNIQLMTWKENNRKGRDDVKNGINNKPSKAVICTNLKTGEVTEYYSTKDAERKTGVLNQYISKCCIAKYGYKQSKGYTWKYKDN